MINLLAILFVSVTLAVPPHTSHTVTGYIEHGRLLGVGVTEGEGVISFPRCERDFVQFTCTATATDTVPPVLDFAYVAEPMECQPKPARIVYHIDGGAPVIVELGITAPPLTCVYLPVVSNG